MTSEQTARARTMVKDWGFEIGPRNPLLNRNHPGRWMVLECPDEVPPEGTLDGRDGPWCLVGDDLDDLIARAWAFFTSMGAYGGAEKTL